MASQILKSVDFTQSKKSRYLENETLFLLEIKKFFCFVAEVTFNVAHEI